MGGKSRYQTRSADRSNVSFSIRDWKYLVTLLLFCLLLMSGFVCSDPSFLSDGQSWSVWLIWAKHPLFSASIIPFFVIDSGQTVSTSVLVGTYTPIVLVWDVLAICNLKWHYDLNQMCFSMYIHTVMFTFTEIVPRLRSSVQNVFCT